jgi:hypothetical protein
MRLDSLRMIFVNLLAENSLSICHVTNHIFPQIYGPE